MTVGRTQQMTIACLGLTILGSAALGAERASSDINSDGLVDAADLALLLDHWGACMGAHCDADLNGDRRVDAQDLNLLMDAWGADAIPDVRYTVGALAVHATRFARAGAAPGIALDLCGTQKRYEEASDAGGEGGLAGACFPIGPCDDPAMRDASIPDAGADPKTIRLSIHVFCDNAGGNCVATVDDAAAAVARLNADFAPWSFQFVYELEFVHSGKYKNLAANEEVGMKNAYADSPASKLNVYVVNTYNGGNWGTYPWDADAVAATGGIVLNASSFGSAPEFPFVFTHEVGHCLGLLHVFHGHDETPACGDCYEAAGRTVEEGDVTGDRCSDTNATPRNDGHCYDPPEVDACNGNAFTDTPYLNFMSYSYFCEQEFTPQQAGRMHCWTAGLLSGWLVLPAPPTTPGTPSLSKLGGGAIAVAWADNSTDEDGFRVQRQKKSGPNWIDQGIVADVGAGISAVTDAPGPGTFRYRVMAYNENGDSDWSNWQQIKN